MDIIYSGSELAEIGIQIEKNGRDFYDALIKQSKDKKVKDIFRYLAEQEESHIVVFKNILESVQRYEPKQAYPQEYFAYMNALARDHIFTQKDKGKATAVQAKTDKQAIELGIKFEKDSIIFCEGMKEIMRRNDQLIADKLIKEEQKHLTMLNDLKKQLGGM